MLYEIIYEFFKINIFPNGSSSASPLRQLQNMSFDVGGVALNMSEWICHTITISTILLGVVVLYLIVRWIFRVFAGLIRV